MAADNKTEYTQESQPEEKVTVLTLLQEIVAKAEEHEGWPKNILEQVIKAGLLIELEFDAPFRHLLFNGLRALVENNSLLQSYSIYKNQHGIEFRNARRLSSQDVESIGTGYIGVFTRDVGFSRLIKDLNLKNPIPEEDLENKEEISIVYDYYWNDMNADSFIMYYNGHPFIIRRSESKVTVHGTTVGIYALIDHLKSSYLRHRKIMM